MSAGCPVRGTGTIAFVRAAIAASRRSGFRFMSSRRTSTNCGPAPRTARPPGSSAPHAILPHSPIIHGDRERIEKPGQPQALEREGEGEHRERRYPDRPVIEVRSRREELLGQGGQRLPPPKEHVEGP